MGLDIGCPSGTVILSPYDAIVHHVGVDKKRIWIVYYH